MDYTQEVRVAMAEDGIKTNATIVFDSNLHRFHVEGDSKGTLNGWYVLHGGKLPRGVYSCWKRFPNKTLKWSAKSERSMTPDEKRQYYAEIKLATEKQLKEKAEAHAKARKKAKDIWDSAPLADDSHPYLRKKKVKAYGVRIADDGRIIIPLFDADNTLSSLQYIAGDNSKRFLTDGAVTGCYFIIGEIEANKPIYEVEGYATGATIHEATNCPVVVAFNSGNLLPVAQAIRKKYTDQEIIVCGDDDIFDGEDKNTGAKKATEAARAIGAKLVFPQFKSVTKEQTDFNDLKLSEGIETVCKQLQENVSDPSATTPTNKPIDLTTISLHEEGGDKPKKKSQVTILIEIASQLELFYDDKNKGYCVIYQENGSRNVLLLYSRDFREWLSHCYFKLTGRGCNNASVNDALSTIESKAKFNNPQKQVYLRIARVEDKIYIDLCDELWRVIEITSSGWQVLDESPVMFIRGQHMKPLPVPNTTSNGEALERLWNYLSLKKNDIILIVAWLICALRGRKPYPILNVQGEQGSGKSLLCELIRDLIDPSLSSSRNAPSDDKELLTAIVNNAVISIDNISKIDDSLSDSLCRVATGGVIAFRELYTNTDEVLYTIARPIILNGITDVVTRPDLLDRCLSIHLEPIDEANRKTEDAIYKIYRNNKSSITGLLYDLIAGALRCESSTKLQTLPRLADCALWVSAAENGSQTLENGAFLKAYNVNIENSIIDGIEASPMANALLSYIESVNEWLGTASELLDKLNERTHDKYKFVKAWAQTPRGMTNIIKRYSPQFRKLNIEITSYRSHGRNLISIKNLQNVSTPHTPDCGYDATVNEMSWMDD